MSTKLKIASFGEIVWDIYGNAKTLGGAPLNFARYCQINGAQSALISAVGNDCNGSEALQKMRDDEISTEHVSILKNFSTGKVMVNVSDSGHPTYDIVSPAAWDFIEANPNTINFVSSADAIAFGTLAQRSEKSRASLYTLIKACHQKCIKVLDINLRQNYYTRDIILSSLELANILKLNDEELPIISEIFGIMGSQNECLKEIQKRFNLQYAILTRGEHGHTIASDSVFIEAKAKKVKVIDTVGAGDAFTATFVFKILACASPHEASEAASDAAAKVVSKRGA